MKITLEILQKHGACESGVAWFNRQQTNDFRRLCSRAVDEYQFSWAEWLLEKLLTDENKIRYMAYATGLVLPIFEKEYPKNNELKKIIPIVKKYINQGIPKSIYSAAEIAEITDAIKTARSAYIAAGKACCNAAGTVEIKVANAAYIVIGAVYAATMVAYNIVITIAHNATDETVEGAAGEAAGEAAEAIETIVGAAEAVNGTDYKNLILQFGVHLVEMQIN